MLPNGTNPQTALEILAKHFLGYTYVVDGYACSALQWNSEVVYEILRKFPPGTLRNIPSEKDYQDKHKKGA